jgi:2-polyprenyl-3-methyl-5-hydroxy-6-metoxy-1,4-benzoquinol methylase
MSGERSRHCVVCLAPDLLPKWSDKGYKWLQCQNCQSVQTTVTMEEAQLQEHYNDTYYEGHKDEIINGRYVDYIGSRNFIQSNLRRRIDWALPYLHVQSGQRWLDVGCAAGFLLDVVREYGYVPYGLDYADFGPRYARQYLDMPNARQGTLESVPTDFPTKFDVISFIDVLEHVPNPRETLLKTIELTAPGGYIIGETFEPTSLIANITGEKWHAVDPPNHLTIISQKGIAHLMQAQGLELVQSVRMARWLSIPSVMTKFPWGVHIASWVNNTPLKQIGIPIWLNDVVTWIYYKSAQENP